MAGARRFKQLAGILSVQVSRFRSSATKYRYLYRLGRPSASWVIAEIGIPSLVTLNTRCRNKILGTPSSTLLPLFFLGGGLLSKSEQ